MKTTELQEICKNKDSFRCLAYNIMEALFFYYDDIYWRVIFPTQNIQKFVTKINANGKIINIEFHLYQNIINGDGRISINTTIEKRIRRIGYFVLENKKFEPGQNFYEIMFNKLFAE